MFLYSIVAQLTKTMLNNQDVWWLKNKMNVL